MQDDCPASGAMVLPWVPAIAVNADRAVAVGSIWLINVYLPILTGKLCGCSGWQFSLLWNDYTFITNLKVIPTAILITNFMAHGCEGRLTWVFCLGHCRLISTYSTPKKPYSTLKKPCEKFRFQIILNTDKSQFLMMLVLSLILCSSVSSHLPGLTSGALYL